MEVKIKKLHPHAVLPKYAKPGDAGLDLTAVHCEYEPTTGCVVYYTGLAFEIPEGYVGLVFPRSSNANKDLILSNSVGVIDSGYRGEVTFKYRPTTDVRYAEVYKPGDRVGQIIILPYPQIKFIEVPELSKTERGVGSYGSSGE